MDKLKISPPPVYPHPKSQNLWICSSTWQGGIKVPDGIKVASTSYPEMKRWAWIIQCWASLVAQLVKNPLAMRKTWVGKIPWRMEQLPTPVFWPGEFHGLYSPWGCKESDTIERLSLHFTSTQYIAWRIPWTEEPGHDWACVHVHARAHTHTHPCNQFFHSQWEQQYSH